MEFIILRPLLSSVRLCILSSVHCIISPLSSSSPYLFFLTNIGKTAAALTQEEQTEIVIALSSLLCRRPYQSSPPSTQYRFELSRTELDDVDVIDVVVVVIVGRRRRR